MKKMKFGRKRGATEVRKKKKRSNAAYQRLTAKTWIYLEVSSILKIRNIQNNYFLKINSYHICIFVFMLVIKKTNCNLFWTRVAGHVLEKQEKIF